MFGNFDIGSSLIGWSRLSMSAEHDCRARPLMIIVQMPHTCSRQFICQTGGVVRSPALLTGFIWISIRHEMMLRFGRYGISNCSQYCGESGLARRRIWISTVFGVGCADILSLRRLFLPLAVVALPWLNQRDIDRVV